MPRENITRRADLQEVRLLTSTGNALQIANEDVNGLNVTGDFTLETNFRADSLAQSFYLLSKYSFSTNERQYALIYAASINSINLNVSGDGTGGTLKQFRLSSVDIEPDTDYHIAVVYDATAETAVFYVNGQRQSSFVAINSPVGTPLQSSDVDFCIGCLQNGGVYGAYLNGKVWDCRVWNVARTPTQIKENRYQLSDTDRNGLVGRWVYSQTGYVDESGNGNNLSEIGSPLINTYNREVQTGRQSINSRQVIS